MAAKIREKKLHAWLPPAFLLLALGVALMVFTFYSTYGSLEDEHRSHLMDLAWSADRNLSVMLSQSREELWYAAAFSPDAENAYLSSGDGEAMAAHLNSFPVLRTSYISAIVLLREGKPVLSSDGTDGSAYTFPETFDPEALCLCTHENGDHYLAVIRRSPFSEMFYAAMLELPAFYRQLAGNELADEYWLVLYNLENQLFLQNDKNQPEAKLLSPEEALERQDGISILVKSELEQKINTENYSFDDKKYAAYTRNLMAVIPSGLNGNGLFAVGVAVACTNLENILLDTFLQMSLGCLLILAGICLLMAIILRNRRANEALREKTELMRQQNESMQELLEKTKELAHHQRLETIGTLTSGIAHEFSNLLTPIMGYSIMTMESLPEGCDELMDNLSEIYSASQRAKSLIARISSLSRKNSESSFQYHSPDQLLDKVEEMTKQSRPKKVEVVKRYHCPEDCVFVHETQIIQMLLNIILNAFQAMAAAGGTLTVETEETDDQVFIRVRDTGHGIPKEALEKIFDPFFTTKEPGHGTGLGLAIARQIAEQHSGTITVQSQAGEGTVFTVTLPRHCRT